MSCTNRRWACWGILLEGPFFAPLDRQGWKGVRWPEPLIVQACSVLVEHPGASMGEPTGAVSLC